jgi:hypothetical protein
VPPECYTPYNVNAHNGTNPTTKLSWTADVWSLGCIYSEAAVWIADGYKGLVDYRRQRLAETDRILFKAGDCFHDGERILQSVLDAHRDIEDRLRRSDYITKDVLESMVDEMLWEEDRPNAKALLRKSEMVLSRARQKLPTNTGEELSRPGSSARRIPARRQPPPTAPLPPLPKGAIPNLSAITEQQYPLNVEKWRSQIAGQQNDKSQSSDNRSAPMPSTRQRPVGPETISDLDREIGGSIASWNMGDTDSAVSPYTPFSSPHASVQYDPEYHRHIPNEGRPRTLQSNVSYEYRRHPAMSQAPTASVISDGDFPDSVSVVRAPAPLSPVEQPQSQPQPQLQPQAMTVPPTELESSAGSVVSDPSVAPQEPKAIIVRPTSKASSRHSSYSSPSLQKDSFFYSKPEEAQGRTKSQKRMGGFSLFPVRTRNNSTPSYEEALGSGNLFSRASSTRGSSPSLSNFGANTPVVTDLTPPIRYLSLHSCLQWKEIHKKAKKSKAPSLPGANIIETLNGRDHVRHLAPMIISMFYLSVS